MGGSGSEELKKCPSPSPKVLWFVNVCERKPYNDYKNLIMSKKNKQQINKSDNGNL